LAIVSCGCNGTDLGLGVDILMKLSKVFEWRWMLVY